MPTSPLRPTFRMAALAAVLAQPLAAQGLGPPAARWDRDFSRIGGVAELADGRVVIVDSRDALVYIGNAQGGGSAQLGRTGDGPEEYRRPFSLVRAPSDTILIYSQNRLIRLAPSGKLVGTIPFTPAALGGNVGPPRGVDRAGWVYWDRVVIRDPDTGEIKRQQQYEIVRFKPGSDKVEVVATAGDHAPELHGNKYHPFAQRDAWILEPDGTIRVARARSYTIDALRGETVASSSAPVPFQPIAVTNADREAYRLDRAKNPNGMSFGGRGTPADGAVTPERMKEMREAYPDEMFPRTKPPFVADGLLRSPGGQLWVIRSPATAAIQSGQVDVLDAAGKRIREITLPEGRRLVGLDRGGIYLAREDDDGLQFLERYAWPAGLR